MTIWVPADEPGVAHGPRYERIARALARDIEEGRLAEGARLPAQRDLARALGVTVGTVGRAYRHAEERGLVRGEIGRGTFVCARTAGADDPVLDLSVNYPDPGGLAPELRAALQALARQPDLDPLLGVQPPAGAERHRQAGARWLAATGLEVAPEQLVVTSGVQHGLLAAFSTLARPGDRILCGALTFGGMLSLARLLHLELEPVALDAEGVRPDALERACSRVPARALYCMPTLQNPTVASMPDARRRELAQVARRHGLAIVEDDTFGFLPSERPPPLAHYLPEATYTVAGLSKPLAAGLRVAYLCAPESAAERLATCVRTTLLMAPGLLLELATRWLQDGTAARVLAERRAEARARSGLAAEVWRGLRYRGAPETYHLWLELPEPWRAGDFTARAVEHGVRVSPAEAFAAGRDAVPHAVRVCIGAAASRDALRDGLLVLAQLARSQPEPARDPI